LQPKEKKENRIGEKKNKALWAGRGEVRKNGLAHAAEPSERKKVPSEFRQNVPEERRYRKKRDLNEGGIKREDIMTEGGVRKNQVND